MTQAARHLAREIARLRPDVRVVLTSGYVSEDPVAGFPFVPRPWRTDTIAAVVEGR